MASLELWRLPVSPKDESFCYSLQLLLFLTDFCAGILVKLDLSQLLAFFFLDLNRRLIYILLLRFLFLLNGNLARQTIRLWLPNQIIFVCLCFIITQSALVSAWLFFFVIIISAIVWQAVPAFSFFSFFNYLQLSLSIFFIRLADVFLLYMY